MARLRLRLVRGHYVTPPRERRRKARRKHTSDGDGLRLVAYASESAPSQENDGATAREREGEEHGRLSDP